ncbi:MAG: META domain-containing protein [Verrucomicrobiota bacterium]|nr:META domain-containing protein [Verrucomicrobiota bacterium]
MRRFLSLVLLVATGFILTACSTIMPKNRGGAPLEGTTWRLASIVENPIVASGSTPVTIRFNEPDGRVGGFAGCNTIFASYAADDEDISFGPIGATKMLCPENMELEAALINALSQADVYSIKGNELTLLRRERPLLKFVAGN